MRIRAWRYFFVFRYICTMTRILKLIIRCYSVVHNYALFYGYQILFCVLNCLKSLFPPELKDHQDEAKIDKVYFHWVIRNIL